jgi:hypothetical protein
MDYRGVLVVGIVCGAGLLGATGACSGPDPGEVTFSERARGATGELTSGGPSGSSGEDGGTAATSGGPAVGMDAGTTPAPDPVFGTSTFAAGAPGPGAPAKVANAAHGADASGKDCMAAGCHQGKWAFGGTLYSDAAGTARVKDAEIRITGPDGNAFAKTFSDVDGNFWVQYVAPVPANSRVGVRTADGKKMNMSATIGPNEAGCSQAGTCHGGAAGKVYVK